jgi:4-hydroxyphenylacetate 3-monooxygenase
MTRSGADYIRGIQDGRTVLIDGETVNDVTTHAAFKGVVESVGRVYDLANDPANRELMTFPSPTTGEPVNRSFTIPRSEEDLVLRRKALRRTAEVTFGLVGRGPEHVAAYLAAYAAHPEVLARG